jgi:hypothetical protein
MERLKFAQKSGITGVYGDETLVPPRVTRASFIRREHRTGMTALTVLGPELFMPFCSFACGFIIFCFSSGPQGAGNFAASALDL